MREFGNHTGRQQLQAHDFGSNRGNTWPNDASKRPKQSVYNEARKVSTGEDPEKESGKACNQGSNGGNIDPS